VEVRRRRARSCPRKFRVCETETWFTINCTLSFLKLPPVRGADAEILDIVLVAAARNIFSRVLGAVGAEPDPEYLDLDAGLRQALAVGRPFGEPAG